jgi:Domain of unknown function (DUF222)
MFDAVDVHPEIAALAEAIAALRGLDPDVDAAVRIDRIRLLEELKSVAAAAQAAETAAFAADQRAAQSAAGVKLDAIARSTAGQVGLARRISPFQARRYVGWATILTTELPHTFTALSEGRVSEWRAILVARETAWLSRQHRAIVDGQLAPLLATLGDRRTEAETRKLAYRLDPEGAVAKVRGAESDRRVSLRPAPDAMARLTALLPVAQGVAAYAALMREADSLVGRGDPRGKGQVMADTLVQRVTGQAEADAVPVEISLLMTADALLDPDGPSGKEPAHLDGYGPIPAPLARHLALGADGGDGAGGTPRWIRRLFTRPDTGQLVAMESRRRTFTAGQRRFLKAHDQWCRTPYCEAPIRHADHINPAEAGGPTHVSNGRGFCEACNYIAQTPGWRSQVIETITPTGHRYRSRPPDPPGAPSPLTPDQQRLRALRDKGWLAA